MPLPLTVIILAKDEEIHIQRAIVSASKVSRDIYVIDSGSADRTTDIAIASGAKVLRNEWVNHSVQFNWALAQLPRTTEWVLRLDADEILSDALVQEIHRRLAGLPSKVSGVSVGRRMNFLGERVRWGGVFPTRTIRLFKFGRGRCEDRWMDEHIVVDGDTAHFSGEIIDDNARSLTWWTTKHNHYASLEAIEVLDLEYGFLKRDILHRGSLNSNANFKRWIKDRLYIKIPAGLRSLLYFIYRYVIRLGFLEKGAASYFHILQGFWYRYLVDAKISEVKKYKKERGCSIEAAVFDVLHFQV